MLMKEKLKFFPFPQTLSSYSKKKIKFDLLAGLNVALLAFPQGMAYAWIAGLPIQFGLYCSAVAAIAGSFFTRTRFIILGPTNATSVMLLSSFAAMGVFNAAEKAALLPLLLLMIGCFLILGAYLKMANLIQFISRSVITGYITAAAALIIANQAGHVLGLDDQESATTFYDICRLTILNISSADMPSIILSFLTLGVYLALQKKFRMLPNVAITLVVMSVIAFAVNDEDTFKFLSSIDARDWKLTFPVVDFSMISKLASTAVAIAFLCVLEGLSIGKTLAARAGKRLDVNQEMYSFGMANLGCSFFSCMPASGSLTRSMLNWSSGAVSPIAGLCCGCLCALGALTLGPLIGHVPRAALAVLVICIGVSLINRNQIRIVTKSTQSDAIVFFTTLTAGLLFPLDIAIYLGTGVSIVCFMHKASMPEMVEYTFNPDGQLTALEDEQKRPDPEISIVHVEGNLFFGAAELFRDQIRRICEDSNLKVLVLKMRNAHHLDATSAMALEELIVSMKEKERILLISEVRKDTVRLFKNSGLLTIMDRKHVFLDVSQNPLASTSRALQYAQEILGREDVKVSIYAESTGDKSINN